MFNELCYLPLKSSKLSKDTKSVIFLSLKLANVSLKDTVTERGRENDSMLLPAIFKLTILPQYWSPQNLLEPVSVSVGFGLCRWTALSYLHTLIITALDLNF